MAGIFDRIAGASGTDGIELTVEPVALGVESQSASSMQGQR